MNYNDLTPEAKNLYHRSFGEYSAAPKEKRPQMLAHLQKQLTDHENGLDKIGFGYADDYVQAAKFFLQANPKH